LQGTSPSRGGKYKKSEVFMSISAPFISRGPLPLAAGAGRAAGRRVWLSFAPVSGFAAG